MVKINILLAAILSCLCSSSHALKFHYDNYSELPELKYSFTFNDRDWIGPGDINTKSLTTLSSGEMSNLRFNELPKSWKIEATNQMSLHCWDQDGDDKKFHNILTLNNESLINRDNLLLDVTDAASGGFKTFITDLDGNGVYSNVIICRPATTSPVATSPSQSDLNNYSALQHRN